MLSFQIFTLLIDYILFKKSPFTTIFKEILDAITIQCDDNLSEATNDYFSPEFVNFLQDKFMPYCFIFSSFTLKDQPITRISNGLIENYNNYKKSSCEKNQLPHVYVNDCYKSYIGACKIFQNSFSSRKRKIDAVYDDEDDDDDDENITTAQERYQKKGKFLNANSKKSLI